MTNTPSDQRGHHGTVTVGDDGRINGVAVGVNLGRIVYGRDPQEDERRRLAWYLASLANKLVQLPLQGIDQNLDQGAGIALPQVYTEMALQERTVDVAAGRLSELQPYIEDVRDADSFVRAKLRPEYSPDWVLPSVAISVVGNSKFAGSVALYRDGVNTLGDWYASLSRDASSASDNLVLDLARQMLITEAIQNDARMVLLGDPGSGKSTFMRHLAWALAQRGLDQLSSQTALAGWNVAHRLLPVLLPLRTLAGRLAGAASHDSAEQYVFDALLDDIGKLGIRRLDDALTEALVRGKALLLFDGLDEVPLDGTPGVASRHDTLLAVRAFCRLYPRNRAVITCRTRAFDDTLRDALGWPVATLAPFTLGQIRHFVPAWYHALGGKLQPGQARLLSDKLITTIVGSPKLRELAASPLLLTLMALVLLNKGELPRDRPQLYEAVLDLLLGQWDAVRDGQPLGAAIGLPDWGSDRFRRLLDKLSYDAHIAATSGDGRGRLRRSDLRDALIEFFTTARVPAPGDTALRWLAYVEQRSGLLAADDDHTYAFVHLTLQEHCAGRHMLLGRSAATLVAQHRAEDRWREPILLGLGVAQQSRPELIERILTDLIDREESGRPKDAPRWYRDLILAAEIGVDRDWNYLRTQEVAVDRIQRDLLRGLVEILSDKAHPLPAAERVRAGFLLGDLGDPRVPVSLDDWRRELTKAQAGGTSGYFCRVDAREYTIGSADADADANDGEKPQYTVTFDAPFLIARYPITNAQWQAWVEQAGGKPSYYGDDADLNRPNQPVAGIQWHWCNDFCAWLSEQLSVAVRMPTEQEWEAAARGGDARRYPWGDEWIGDRAATEENQETHGARYTVPVGCYPAGAAPCGALDMAGNVWEWTASEWRSYPGAKKPFTEDQYRVLRSGSWGDNRKRVRCGARDRSYPGDVYFNGFRVVVAPRLAH
jgi:formylglycine-generating enzyme required for sulfatase activity